MRVLAVVVLTVAILALPERRPSLHLSYFPCSVDEIIEGMNNWRDHRINPTCPHTVLERVYFGCWVNYWSKGLD